MNAQTRAVIDVGTNTIKMMVARADQSQIEILVDCRAEPSVRLGAGFYKDRRLRPKTMRAAAEAIRLLSLRAATLEPVSIQVIATSAVRDATNRQEFIELVRERAGFPLEVLSGAAEAELIFRGVASDRSISAERLLVLGFGGGSTAAIVSDGRRIRYRSFDLGTVRLMELLRLGKSPKPADEVRCRTYLAKVFKELIIPQLNAVLPSKKAGVTLVATGGTVTSLARIKIRAHNLSWVNEQSRWLDRADVSRMASRLWNLTSEERRLIPGLPAGRHDVILPGVAIVEAVMEHLGFERLRVTLSGMRDGAVLRASEGARLTPESDSLAYIANLGVAPEQVEGLRWHSWPG